MSSTFSHMRERLPEPKPSAASSSERPDPVRAAEVVAALREFLNGKIDHWKDTRKPKHTRLAQALFRAITDGVVREGDKLPSESELTRMTPFSLGTVQKSLKNLMIDGLVTRKPGVGTIVRPWRQRMESPLHCRFSRDSVEFVPVYPTIISREPVRSPGPWRRALGDGASIVRIDRRIMIGELFPLVANFYVDANRYSLFAHRSTTKLQSENFKLLISEQSGAPITRIDHRLTFVRPSENLSRLLDIRPDTTALKIKVMARDGAGQAHYYQEILVPPNDLDLAIDSRLDGLAGF